MSYDADRWGASPHFLASTLPRCQETPWTKRPREPFWDPLLHVLTPLQKIFSTKIGIFSDKTAVVMIDGGLGPYDFGE